MDGGLPLDIEVGFGVVSNPMTKEQADDVGRHRDERVEKMGHRLFLKAGDTVVHLRYPTWGRGRVIEEKSSTLSGGTCIVRVVFGDGNERSFINDLDNYNCCYYAGIRLYEDEKPVYRC